MKRLAILFVLLLARAGWATVYYVNPDGSNTSPYDTWAKGATAINTALTTAKGDASGPHTLYVPPGTYTDYPNCDDAELVGMQLLGVAAVGSTTIAGENVVIINVQAGNHGVYLKRNTQAVKGFTFRNADATHYHVYTGGGDGIVVQNCYSQNAGGAHIYLSATTNFNVSYNVCRGITGKTIALRTTGACSGTIAYNLFGPSQRYNSAYIRLSHSSGTVNVYNNDISNSYVYAVLQDNAGATTSFTNNKVWANQGATYSQPQLENQSTLLISSGTFNYDHNLLTGTPVGSAALVSGGTEGAGNIYSQLPKLVGRNFAAGFITLAIDDDDLTGFETFANTIHTYGGHATLFASGTILDKENYESRINALLAAGHALGSHTWSHSYLSTTNAFTIRYVGTDTTPHIAITAGDATGSIVLTTTQGNDNVSYNFDAASTVATWDASSTKISLGVGSGKWELHNIATIAASPDFTSTKMRCTSLAAIDADLSGAPLAKAVPVAKSDETTGFLKDELVDWKADLEAIFGTVSTMATPGAQTEADAIYTAVVNAGYLGCRGSGSYSTSGASFIDLRECKIERLVSLDGSNVITSESMTEAAVRAKARDIAAYLWDNAAALSFYWHGIDLATGLQSEQLGWFCDELQTAGIPIVTFPYLVSYLRDAGNGWTVAGGVYSNLNLPLSTSRRLLPGSPCINAGTDLGLTTDCAGTTVPQGSAPDMGAYEFLLPVAATTPDPTNEAVDVSVTPTLSWTDGGGSTSYDVYLSDDASIGVGDLVSDDQAGTTYTPGASLTPYHTYYWRIDSNNDAGTTTGTERHFRTESKGGAGALLNLIAF